VTPSQFLTDVRFQMLRHQNTPRPGCSLHATDRRRQPATFRNRNLVVNSSRIPCFAGAGGTLLLLFCLCSRLLLPLPPPPPPPPPLLLLPLLLPPPPLLLLLVPPPPPPPNVDDCVAPPPQKHTISLPLPTRLVSRCVLLPVL
jgi:hypothetical protein